MEVQTLSRRLESLEKQLSGSGEHVSPLSQDGALVEAAVAVESPHANPRATSSDASLFTKGGQDCKQPTHASLQLQHPAHAYSLDLSHG